MTSFHIGWVSNSPRPEAAEGARVYGSAHGLVFDPRWQVHDSWVQAAKNWQGVILQEVPQGLYAPHDLPVELPVIALQSDTGSFPGYQVMPDYQACGALAFGELVRGNPATCVIVRGSVAIADEDSCAGFLHAALSQGHRVLDPDSTRKLNPTGQSQPQLAPAWVDLFQDAERPVALFVPDVRLGYGIVAELQSRGFAVPGDFSLVTLGAHQATAAMASVPLTTVDPDDWQQGFVAARLLHQYLVGEAVPPAISWIPPLGITCRGSTGGAHATDPAVEKVRSIIGEHFSTDWKVPDLARLAGVGRRNLEDRFRKEFKTSIHAALVERRIQEARRLLVQSSLSLPGVAEACGFSSVSYFSTVFKRETGRSPSDFRHRPEENL